MISINKTETCTIVLIFGIKIRLTTWSAKHEAQHTYGLCDLVKERADLPYCSRGVCIQHGWTVDKAPQTDQDEAKWLMLCWSKRYNDYWDEMCDTPCRIVGAPFIHFRRRHGIEIAPTAQGTVAFPGHNLRKLEQRYDLDEYCTQLKSLPARFQPVTVCLHHWDIEYYHLDEEYERRGLKTVCAARDVEGPFYEGFYNILRRHRFTTSNALGTHLFYAVEMGLPFFLLGERPIAINSNDNSLFDLPNTDFLLLKKAHELFSTPPCDTISDEQREFVLAEMGMNDCLSPEELALELRRAADKEYYIPELVRRWLALFKEILRHPHQLFQILRFHKFVQGNHKLLADFSDA